MVVLHLSNFPKCKLLSMTHQILRDISAVIWWDSALDCSRLIDWCDVHLCWQGEGSMLMKAKLVFPSFSVLNSQQARFNYWQWRLRINYTGYVCLHRRKWQHKYFFSFHTQRFSSLCWIQQHNKDWLVLPFISLLKCCHQPCARLENFTLNALN